MQGKWLADLNYLIQDADLGLSNLADASLLALIMTKDGDVVDYDGTTDSLQALAEAIAGIAAGTGTPNAFLAAVGGLLNDVAATGAVSDAKTAVSYLKQIVTMLLEGTYGLSNLQVLIAAIQTDLDNGTDGLGALKSLLDAIPTTMIGTNSAALATTQEVPSADAVTNTLLRDVIGNKEDAAAEGVPGTTESMMALQKQATIDTETLSRHSSLYTGDNFYVDAAMSDDTEDGTTPRKAKKTIGAAIGVASAGDKITVKAGTYTEQDIDINLAALEVEFEIGSSLILTGSGKTALTVSANYVRISGNLVIVADASQTGLLVSGAYGNFSNITCSAGDINFEISGTANIFERCVGSVATTSSFDITANSQTLRDCSTTGAFGSTIGYKFSSNASSGLLLDCTSSAHSTAGYSLESGCDNWSIVDCSSGGRDGKRVDGGASNVWSNFSPDGHDVKFGGNVWYVNKTTGNVNHSGQTPEEAFLTINAAIAAAAAGDAINVSAGTYVEDVVMSKSSMELWFEKGATLDGTGTCLTVSGGNCKVVGPVLITPAADQIGVVVDTLGSNDFYKIKVIGSASAGGFDIDTALNDFTNCRVGGVKANAKAWDIGGSSNVFERCSTNGTTTSYGFYVHGGSALVRGKLDGCTSTGHQTSGFYLDNITGMTVVNCTSGAGDGEAVDVNSANAWCNYCFDNIVTNDITLSAAGAETVEYNLFKVSGGVKVLGLFFHVTETFVGSNTDCFFDLYSTNGRVYLSKEDSGNDLGTLPVGSYVLKLDKQDKVLTVANVGSGPASADQIDTKEEGFRVFEDNTGGSAVATYIRFNHTCSAGGSGKIHAHCEYEPVGEGFLAAV